MKQVFPKKLLYHKVLLSGYAIFKVAEPMERMRFQVSSRNMDFIQACLKFE